VKLYPNYLPHVESKYLARTDNEASLSVEDVCAALKNRGGFTGSYDDLVGHVQLFHRAVECQLCDSFAMNAGPYSIHPNVGGTFNSENEGHDRKKHPVTFRFRVRAPLCALADLIVVEVEGLADTSGYIDEFIYVETGAVSESATPGGQFSVAGHKIKVAGDNADMGVYFVSAADPGQRVKVPGHLAENAASKVIGVIPALAPGAYKLEIVTQYSSGTFFLKESRPLALRAELTVAQAGA
jgi:hypothetical protein